MTKFKETKKALEKALGGKANAVKAAGGWEAATIIKNSSITVYLFKRKDGTVYYYATIGEKPISWHNNVTGPETWTGENYYIKKTKDERRSLLHVILGGVCHMGHFAPECLEQALAF